MAAGGSSEHAAETQPYLPGNCGAAVRGAPWRYAQCRSSPYRPSRTDTRLAAVVLKSDRAGSSWYIGTGFFFAPLLIVLSPWPVLTAAAWVTIGVAGLWLGLLGIAMATGLAVVLRSGREIPEDYWRSIIDYPRADSALRKPGTHPVRPGLLDIPVGVDADVRQGDLGEHLVLAHDREIAAQ